MPGRPPPGGLIGSYRGVLVRKPGFCPSGRPEVARAPPPGGHIGAYRRVLVRKPRFCLSGRPGAPRAPPWGLAGRENPELPARPGPGAGSQARPAPGARPSQGRQWRISERLNRGAHASAPQTRTHALPLTNRVHPNCTDSLGDAAAAHAGLKNELTGHCWGSTGQKSRECETYRGF